MKYPQPEDCEPGYVLPSKKTPKQSGWDWEMKHQVNDDNNKRRRDGRRA